MRIQVAGRQVEVGEALTTRITEELSGAISKFFASRPADAVVTVGRDGPFFVVDCTLHLDSGMLLQAEGKGADAHLAFQDALTRVEKRVRRYKRRLKNHHSVIKTPLPGEPATAYVLSGSGGEAFDIDAGPDDGEMDEAGGESPASLIIAETTVAIRTMPVAMAVLQLELAETPALMFRNAAHGGLNLVYRRPDGNVGWVDPQRLNGAHP